MPDLRYPIGPFEARESLTPEERSELIEQIAAAPMQLRAAITNLTEEQLETPYREGGWTVRQVVHHVADSHLNAYMRFRLAVTEDEPTLRPYDETRWAMLEDARTMDPGISLALLDALHGRLASLLWTLPEDDFRRTLRHPEHDGVLTVDWLLTMYAWHGRHHTAHITSLRERNGW